ncbi:MAG: membrane protein insertion efficiency factor YidD [Bacilli bacterium]
MKKAIIKLIRLYQNTPLHCHNNCRFYPTCSEYTIISIERFGLIKGIYLGIKRIIRCNPFGKYGLDPVPTKEKK